MTPAPRATLGASGRPPHSRAWPGWIACTVLTAAGPAWGASLGEASGSYMGEGAAAALGECVASAGDVDGDGLDDLLVGAPQDGEGASEAGQAYLGLGRMGDWPQVTSVGTAAASFLGEHSADHAGCGLSGAGDVDGDGYADLLIGAEGSDAGAFDAGQVYLVRGRAEGWVADESLASADASFVGEAEGDRVGIAASGGGDINGDGYADLLLGADRSDSAATDAGQVYLFLGRPSGWSSGTALGLADVTFTGQGADDGAGPVAAVGDASGDGYGDLVVGAPGNDAGGANAGRVYVIRGWSNPCLDGDGDGFGSPGHADCPAGAEEDCDDGDAAVHPDATEACNGQDDNCNNGIPPWERDEDGDGEMACAGDCDDGDPAVHSGAPDDPCDGVDHDCDGIVDELDDLDGDGLSTCDGDCDDADSGSYPGAPEVCDGLDNNCNDLLAPEEQDGDGDGYLACAGDCHDDDADSHPDAPELCDGYDNYCNGGLPPEERDEDGDGYASCEGDCDDADPSLHPLDQDGDGHSPCQGDCDDADPARFPAAVEACNGIDDDCDGGVPADEIDGDGDGMATCAGDCDDEDATTDGGDADGDGWSPCDGDCDDADPARFPGAHESCNGVDDGCAGQVPTDEIDGDGDGWMPCEGDCAEGEGGAYPGARERCDNGVDDDCDGMVDGRDTVDCPPDVPAPNRTQTRGCGCGYPGAAASDPGGLAMAVVAVLLLRYRRGRVPGAVRPFSCYRPTAVARGEGRAERRGARAR